MHVQRPELLKPRDKHWSKIRLPFTQAIPVIPSGLVAARVLAFQAAPIKTWTNSRLIPRQQLPKSQEFEAPPLMKRKPTYTNPQNSCQLFSSLTQTLSSDDHQSSCILSIGKPVPGSESGEGRSADDSILEDGDVETEEPIGLFRDDMADNLVDEAGDILDGAMYYQPQVGINGKGGPQIEKAPGFCLNKLDGDVRLPEAKRSYLNMPPTETHFLGGRVGNSTIPHGSSRSQQALTLGPLDPTILEIEDDIELHYLSPGQIICSSTGRSVSSGHRNLAKTLSCKELKPLESTTPARTVRHSMSTTSMRPPSQPSRTQSMLNRWSWWKLGGRKSRAAGGLSGNNRGDDINPASEREPLIPLELFPTEPNGYDGGTMGQNCEEEPAYANDPTSMFQISNKEPESIRGIIGSANKGVVSPKNNETQSRFCVELPLPSTPPELDRRSSPDLFVSPSFAADTLSQEGSSAAASTIRLQSDQSGRAMKWRNRGQSFQRVQLIVNLDMRDLVVKAKIEKKGKGKVG